MYLQLETISLIERILVWINKERLTERREKHFIQNSQSGLADLLVIEEQSNMRYLEKLEEAKKKKGRCWTGYKPKAGSVPYSKGSCVKEAYKLIGLALIDEEDGPVTRAADEFAKKKEGESIEKTIKDYAAVYGKPKPKRKKGKS